MKKFYPQLRSIQIRTGIWTLVVGLVMVLGYLWMTNRISMQTRDDLQVAFSDVQGLEVGDKVMYRGMEAGRVKKLVTRQDKVIVSIQVPSDIKLRQGSRFQVWDSSLMGGKVLLIIPGEGSGVLNYAQIQTGEAPEGMMDLISRASTTLKELQITMQDLKGPGGLNDKVERLITNTDATVLSAKGVTDQVRKDLGSTISRLDALIAEVNGVVSENRNPLQRTLQDAPELMANIGSTLDSLQLLAGHLTRSTAALNSGEGTAAKLLNDDELYDKMVKSLGDLEALVQDIKANPKKYVKFSLF